MRHVIHRQLVRWAFGRQLLRTMVALSRWLMASLALPPEGTRHDWRLWRELLLQDGRRQRGLRPLRRAVEAWQRFRRNERLLRWRVFDAERPTDRVTATA